MELLDLTPEPEPAPPPPSRRGIAVVAVLLAAFGVGGWLVSRGSPPLPETVRAAPTTTASLEVSRPTPTPWPERAGACGNTVAVPRVTAPALDEPTGLRLLVAGDGLHAVDLDSGRVSAVGGLAGGYVTSLQRAGSGFALLAATCDELSALTSEVLRLDGDLAPVAPSRSHADQIVTGSGGTYAVDWPDDNSAPVVMHRLDGRGTLRLSGDFSPDSTLPEGILGTSGNFAPAVEVRSRADGHRLRTVGEGRLMGANARAVLLAGYCDEGSPCVLSFGSPAARTLRRVTVPSSRAPTSAAALSPDGRYAAFQLSRELSDPRLYLDHPGPTSDIAVLDLRTGKLRVLDGVELAAKYSAGLTWSPDSSWLVVSLGEGSRTRLLVWRDRLDGLRSVGPLVPGRVLYQAGVLALAP
ncbi:WD40 repeat protein [Motilibacter peucedani]|uniref:WD40 repeat protein n=1 Tax=Motilibacter peucedani TaxID=598650 RepID=A0A420XNK8_9ACTN|nr:PD40 domain-containing protein [Motilibacter peucedani]RKS73768.1 WD40 repeat protein [Motilibacter peucedani]